MKRQFLLSKLRKELSAGKHDMYQSCDHKILLKFLRLLLCRVDVEAPFFFRRVTYFCRFLVLQINGVRVR